MTSRAVQVRDGRGEYTPTDADKLRQMDRLARDAVQTACRDARLAGQIELLDGVPVSTLNQDVYKAALLKTLEIATTDEAERVTIDKEGNEHVRIGANPRQLQALELLLEHRIAEGALLLKAQELGKASGTVQREAEAREQRSILTADQAEQVLAQRRHFLAKVANEGA